MNTPDQYQLLFKAMVVSPPVEKRAATISGKISANSVRYKQVVENWKMPWWIVGIIHSMESSLDFTKHLHNGDPLTARTTHAPAGRPLGTPPFTWEESAEDALKLRGLDNVYDWSIPHTLLELEGYNGFGYARRGIQSPYLWAGSSIYKKGKYVADGHFDPEAVSSQIGAALLLKQFVS